MPQWIVASDTIPVEPLGHGTELTEVPFELPIRSGQPQWESERTSLERNRGSETGSNMDTLLYNS